MRRGWKTASPTPEVGHAPAEVSEGALSPDEEDATLPPRRSAGPLRLAVSLVWILAAVAITVYRTCTGQ